MIIAYFNDGLTASEASHLHESKLLLQEDSCNLLANAAVNPTKRQVNYLHDEWRKLNYGPIHEPLIKLKEKSVYYDELGMCNLENSLKPNLRIKIQNDN